MAHMPTAERRQQLIAAAFRVVASDGVAAASTRRIANEAGVPPAIVHYAFRSVDELIDTLTASVFDEAATATAEALTARGTVEQTLAAAVRDLWSGYRGDPARHLAVVDLIAQALRRPTSTAILREHQRRITGLAAEFLTDLADRHNARWLDPVEDLGRVLTSTVDGVLQNWLIDRDDRAAEAALNWLIARLAARCAG